MKCRFVIVVVDYFSKWAEVELMQDVTTSKVTNMLRRLFYREGIPEIIVSDNGSQFTSRTFVEFLEEHGVQHLKCPVYHP